jgi:hypothetical protein
MKRYRPLPTCSELKNILKYDKSSGTCTYLKSGKEINGTDTKGYKRMCCKGTSFLLHRVIWKLVTGTDPEHMVVDHIDQNKSNNSWTNLRLTGHSENVFNGKLRTNSKYSLGVQDCRGRYRATIMWYGKKKHLGVFATPELAAEARRKANLELAKERNDFVMEARNAIV